MQSSPTFNIIVLIGILAFRAYYNYKYGTYRTFAFSATIILVSLYLTIFKGKISTFLISPNATSPLFALVFMFIIGFLIYQILNLEALKRQAWRYMGDSLEIISSFSTTIVVFIEIVATILAYKFLDQLPEISTKSFIMAQLNPNKDEVARLGIFIIIFGRLIYNLLLGKYQTLVFWVGLITTIFLYSLFTTRATFANNVIIYVIIQSFIYRYIATEINFYKLFHFTGWKESYFAFVLHVLTALVEITGSIMIYNIFTNSFSHLQHIQQYYALL